MTNLPVPYSSQWDADATQSNNDCGATCIKMILALYGEQHTTNEIQAATGAGTGLVGIGQLLNAITSFGFRAQVLSSQSPAQLKALIDAKTPPIALVHMGDLTSRQDKNFSGGHFLVPVGYYQDGYYVNDPDFSGTYRQDGDHHNYLTGEFEKAWGDCHLDGGNPDNYLIVIQPKTPPPPPAPVVVSDPQAKIDMGGLGVMELQAVKSTINDQANQIISLKNQIAGLQIQVAENADAAGKLVTANQTITSLNTIIQKQKDTSILTASNSTLIGELVKRLSRLGQPAVKVQ